jgi:hypothetical protein
MVRVALYCLLAALLFAVAVTGSLTPHVIGWFVMQGLLVAAAMFPIARWTASRSTRLFWILWLPLMLVGVVTLASEAAIFIKTTPREVVTTYGRVAIAYTVLAAALAFSTFRFGVYDPSREDDRGTPTVVRIVAGIAAAGVIYLVLYFAFGGLAYQLLTKPYYTHQVAGAGALKAGEDAVKSIGAWFIVIQIARGAAMTLAFLPAILSLRVSHRSAAIIIGSAMWVVGGLAPLIVPNTVMPDRLRVYHMIEIFTQNFPLGVFAVLLLKPKARSEPSALRAAAD